MTRPSAVLCAVLCALGACAPPDTGGLRAPGVEAVLTRAIRRGPGALAAIDTVGPAQWEYLYVFGPYTTVDAMRRCVSESHGFETYAIERRDDIDVLIFKDTSGALFSMRLPRTHATFSEDALTREYPRGRATFVVRRTRSGALELVPLDTTARRCT